MTINKINHVMLNAAKNSPALHEVLTLIAMNNNGLIKLIPEDIVSYVTCRTGLFPDCKLAAEITHDDHEKNLKTARVSEDNGSTWSLIFNQLNEWT